MNDVRPDDPAAARVLGSRQSAGALALGVIALGGFVLFEAVTGPGNPGYAQVGPGAFPGIVGTALFLAGFALLLQSVRGHWRVTWSERASPNGQTAVVALRNAAAPLLMAAALILDVVLMPLFGFVIASAVLFALVAAALGSRRIVLDAALGLVFAGAIYLIFVHGLGLHLPAGSVWETLLWRF